MTQSADDPSTWTFTQNAALIILDHGWSESGRRIPRAMFEQAIEDWKEKADACDVAMSLAVGGTEPRFQLAGGYGFDQAAKSVGFAMENAIGGRLQMRADGAAILDLAIWEAPRVTLSDDHIIGYSGLRRGLQPGDTYNEIRATFMSPANAYQTQEAQPWQDADSIAINGLQSTTLDLTWCPSHRQARARQKLEAARLNPEWVGSLVTNAYGLNVIGERTITVEIADLGLTGAAALTCEVTDWKYNAANATCQIGIRSITESAFNLTTDEQGAAPTSDSTGVDAAISAPASFTAVSTSAKTIAVSCSTPTRDDLQFVAEYSVAGADTWNGISISLGVYTGETAVLPSGSYDVRGYFIATSGRKSTYTSTVTVEVGTTTAPAAPTGSATGVSE
jgi:hypothetical protein